MQLNKNEQSILGYFPSSIKAKKAADELQKANLVPGEGYLQIGRVSHYAEAVMDNSDYNKPINNTAILHELADYSNSEGLGQNLLLTVSDSESGLGFDHDYLVRTFVVTLVTGKDNVEEAAQIMKNNGCYN